MKLCRTQLCSAVYKKDVHNWVSDRECAEQREKEITHHWKGCRTNGRIISSHKLSNKITNATIVEEMSERLIWKDKVVNYLNFI